MAKLGDPRGEVPGAMHDSDDSWADKISMNRQNTLASMKNTRGDGRFFITLPDGQSMEIDLTLLDDDELVMLDDIDEDDSGEITLKEILQVKYAETTAQRQSGALKKVAVLLVFFVMLLLVGMFVTTWAALEMAKEMRAGSDTGVMATSSGDTVKVSSSQMTVNPDGSMTSSHSATGRRLTASDPPGANIKTAPIMEKKALASSLPDKFFLALHEISIYSDKGAVLRLAIHGFARVPLLHARCGNIVHLYTAWNGRVTLDSTDMTFDPDMAKAFEGAGFTVAVGGRRLQDASTSDGFFGALQDAQASSPWTCAGVPLPSLPPTYVQDLTVYRPCVPPGKGKITEVKSCDSAYGGVIPGAGPLPANHQQALLGKASQMAALLGKSSAAGAPVFTAVQQTIVKSPSWQIQTSTWANNPGAAKVSVFNRKTSTEVTFQKLLVGASADLVARFHCTVTDPTSSALARNDQAESKGAKTAMHFELLDTTEENGKLFRHFRMMPDDSFLAYLGAPVGAARPSDNYYEFWDDADTLQPYRILSPDGTLTVFNSLTKQATDADATAALSQLVKGDAMACPGASATTAAGDEVPVLVSPEMDLAPAFLSFYLRLHASDKYEVPANPSYGWDTAAALVSTSSRLAVFYSYARRTLSAIAMPDACAAACPALLTQLKEFVVAETAVVCDFPGLNALTNCVILAGGSACMSSNYAKTARTCSAPALGRRLQEVKNVVKNALDGMTHVETASLHKHSQIRLARVLGLGKLPAGRIVLNGSDVTAEQTLEERRLQTSSLVCNTVTPQKADFDNCCKLGVSSPGSCDMTARTGQPRACSAGIMGRLDCSAGGNKNALSLAGIKCLEGSLYTLPRPFGGKVCVASGGAGMHPDTSVKQCPTMSWGVKGSVTFRASLTFSQGDIIVPSTDIIIALSAKGITGYVCVPPDGKLGFLGNPICDTQCYSSAGAVTPFSKQIGTSKMWVKVEYNSAEGTFGFDIGLDALNSQGQWQFVASQSIISSR